MHPSLALLQGKIRSVGIKNQGYVKRVREKKDLGHSERKERNRK